MGLFPFLKTFGGRIPRVWEKEGGLFLLIFGNFNYGRIYTEFGWPKKGVKKAIYFLSDFGINAIPYPILTKSQLALIPNPGLMWIHKGLSH